jgi:hypothetical protein
VTDTRAGTRVTGSATAADAGGAEVTRQRSGRHVEPVDGVGRHERSIPEIHSHPRNNHAFVFGVIDCVDLSA